MPLGMATVWSSSLSLPADRIGCLSRADVSTPSVTITPPVTRVHHLYNLDHNGIIDRFFRSVKEECVGQYNVKTVAEARRVLWQWLRWKDETGPHPGQTVGCLNPQQFRARQSMQVA